MLSANSIVELHDHCTRVWHQGLDTPQKRAASGGWPEIYEVVRHQHQANYELWHIEDEARRPGATDADLSAVKRRIDQTNQRRNDLAEELDQKLMERLHRLALPLASAPLHSESPGLIVDRLSILALKIYHTREEVERHDAPSGHVERNRARLQILEEQRQDLADCLDALWQATLDGSRRFKVYRQLKMYNDPTLNPAIYRKPRE